MNLPNLLADGFGQRQFLPLAREAVCPLREYRRGNDRQEFAQNRRYESHHLGMRNGDLKWDGGNSPRTKDKGRGPHNQILAWSDERGNLRQEHEVSL